MRKAFVGLAFALVVSMILVPKVAAQGRKVYFTGEGKCFDSVYLPIEIDLSCASGGISIEETEWTEWGESTARGVGVLSYNECPASVPAYRCDTTNYDEATVELSRPVYCENVQRWQFTRLFARDLEASTPALQSFPESYKCSSFAPLKPTHIHIRTPFWSECEQSFGKSILSHDVTCHIANKVISKIDSKSQRQEGPITALIADGFLCTLNA